jgi:hypothetical protein
MLYYDSDPQRQLVRERTKLLATEMQKARARDSAAQADGDRSRWASGLLRRARRLGRGTPDQAPAYEG